MRPPGCGHAVAFAIRYLDIVCTRLALPKRAAALRLRPDVLSKRKWTRWGTFNASTRRLFSTLARRSTPRSPSGPTLFSLRSGLVHRDAYGLGLRCAASDCWSSEGVRPERTRVDLQQARESPDQAGRSRHTELDLPQAWNDR